MGSYCHYYEIQTNCTNCKKEYKTAHPVFDSFCSKRCEKRYQKRQENGMVPEISSGLEFVLGGHNGQGVDNDKIEMMRERIKHLSSQLKQNGIKPKRTPY